MPIEVQGVKMPNGIYRQIAAAAERGAKFLDENAGKWFNRVKTTELEMQDSCRCIYGQLDKYSLLDAIKYGAAKAPRGVVAHNAMNQLGYVPPISASEWADHEAAREAVWAALQEEWLRQIKTRRDAAKVAA